LDPC
jgi:hypothetical protein